MASGKVPDGSRQLVSPKITRGKDGVQVESHRAGNDLTFSAPKSVSIGYAAGNRELKAIWDRAVVNTMRHVEAHYSLYRTPDGLEMSGNIVAAKFDHVTSRALDPEVHSHVFLVNMVHTRQREWKANEPKAIYMDKMSLGALARQEAINLYRKAGYEIYFTDREKLLFEIRGVRQEELETFSRRSAAIAQRVSQWKEDGRFPGVSDTVLKQMAALDTRDPKREVTKEDVRREWDRGFGAAGTTAQEVRGRIEAAKCLQGAQPSMAAEPDKNADERTWQALKPGDENWDKENAQFSDILVERRKKEYLYGDTDGKISNDELRGYARDGNPTAQPEIDRRYINEAYIDFEEWSAPSETERIGETIECLEDLRETIIRHEKFLQETSGHLDGYPQKTMVAFDEFSPSRKREEFLQRVNDRIKELDARLLEDKKEFRYKAPGDYPPTLATVVPHTNVPIMKKQSGYVEAKRGGDMNAARDVVDALVKREVLDDIKSRIPENTAVYVVPVIQKEGPHLNMLPVAYAERLAEHLGGTVWTRVAKVSGKHNTGAAIDERLHNRQVFRGELPPENSIIIIADDAFTVGGTLASLIDHLAQEGNTPLCATTLATGRYGKKLAPTQELINGLLEKTGISENEFKNEFGYPPQSLTGAEIGSYLLNGARGIDGARARFFAIGSGESFGYPETQTPPAGLDPVQNGSPSENNSATVVKLAADFLTDKEVVFDRARLLKTAVQISGGEHGIEELDAAIDGQGKKDGLHFLGQETHGWQAGREFYTTGEMLELEARNLATLKALEPFSSATSKPEIHAYLRGLAGDGEGALTGEEVGHVAAYRAGLTVAGRDGPVLLSAGQRAHVLNELAGGKGFSVTQGDPGTGKTFVSGIVEKFTADVLEPTGREHHTIYLAYTGKAALEMAKASGKPAYTVDAFLNRYWGDKRGSQEFPGPEPDPPFGKRVVLKLDEASFVGGRQAEQILRVVQALRSRGVEVKLSAIGDTKQLQSIQASPFFSHASELARQGYGDLAVMREITRQKDAGLLEVAKVLNQGRDSRQLGANANEALKMLQDQGRVVEIADRQELTKAAVEHYLSESSRPSPDPAKAATGEKRSVLIVTPLNADRQELNKKIRAARLQAGEIQEGPTVDVLVHSEHGVTVSGYKPGMVLVFNGRRGRDGSAQVPDGVRPNQRGEVQHIDLEKNMVSVAFPDEAKTRTFEMSQLVLTTTLYRKERREFTQGDRIVFEKNTRDQSIASPDGKSIGVCNGEVGEVEKIFLAGDHTVALVRLSDGRKINVHLDRFGPQHIDHGYAVTVHKGQGDTIDSVIPFNFIKPGSENEKSALHAVSGINFSAEQFKQWNAGLSEFEKNYQAATEVSGHRGTVTFVMIADRQNVLEQKGIAVQFHDGRAMIEDETACLQMREAGMYWSGEIESWVTSATNKNAISLLAHHPLKDPGYLEQLRTSLQKMSEQRIDQLPPQGERNYRTEIDTTADVQRFGRTSYNAFNVAFTRARHAVTVFTNSVAGLKKAILTVDEKTTTIGNELIVRERQRVRRNALAPAISRLQNKISQQPVGFTPATPQPEVKLPDPQLELTFKLKR